MTFISMLRNGYRKDSLGNYSKCVECANPATGINTHVERIIRNVAGNIIKIETAYRRKK